MLQNKAIRKRANSDLTEASYLLGTKEITSQTEEKTKDYSMRRTEETQREVTSGSVFSLMKAECDVTEEVIKVERTRHKNDHFLKRNVPRKEMLQKAKCDVTGSKSS